MSQAIRVLAAAQSKRLKRGALLALIPDLVYDDGLTKQCHRDECDIQKIMARADIAGTISHLEKFEGVYADYSDFDFHEQTTKLTKGREIFDDLPAEVRREFGQSPAAFFNYVNDPENKDRIGKLLPDLAKPGTQKVEVSPPDADTQAAAAAASEPASETIEKPPAEPDASPAAS